MNESDRIFVAGHRGLAGSAILRALKREGFRNVCTRSRSELDLTRQSEVREFFSQQRTDIVIDAAARVGGILDNDRHPADFIRENLRIQTNLIEYSHAFGVRKFVFLASSCVYPRLAEQPIAENSLLTGSLEPTNESYAIAKIAGIKMCQAYRKQYGFDAITLMPTNLFGPGDNFDPDKSHVLPALIRKCHEARRDGSPFVEVWGSGEPLREFLYVDDLASAVLFLTRRYSDAAPVNVGSGEVIRIADLARLVAEVVGFNGDIRFDRSKPDGTPRKSLDNSRIRDEGWRPSWGIRDGIAETYRWYLAQAGESPAA